MLKTRGKKNRKPIIVIVLLILGTFVFLSRPVLQRFLREQPRTVETPTPVPAPDSKPQPEVKEPVEEPQAKIAVIIDDVGYPSFIIDDYRKFEGKLTFSVLPFQPESATYAQLLHHEGFEIMIHIPMEPENYPDEDPGEGALFVTDEKDEVERKLKNMIEGTPHARGANNHMGSRATQNPELMTYTLSYLQQHGFYFVDSRTTHLSSAYELSRQLHMRSAERDVFLDNHDDFTYINEQFEKLKRIAKERGTAIGIGHIQNENLLDVLNYQLEHLGNEGIELVFASEALIN